MRKNFEESEEPNEKEMKEIEEMLNQMDEEEERSDLAEDMLMSRNIYHYKKFDRFIKWLKKNGIVW